MRTISVTEATRNFSRVLDLLEHRSEEIIVVRDNQPVAKLVPGAPRLTALAALRDLYRTLPDKGGATSVRDSRRVGRRGRGHGRRTGLPRASCHRVNDVWHAALAIQHGMKIATRNKRDFADLPGVDLVVLRPGRPGG